MSDQQQVQEDIASCDALRNLDEVLQADERSKSFAAVDASGIRSRTLIDHHEAIRGFELNSAVPHAIRVHFETAKNLYLYSWFVYRFYPVAEQQALASLEFALRERLVQADVVEMGKRKTKGLATHLKRAYGLGLIRNEGLKIRDRSAVQHARQRHEFESLEEMMRSGATVMVVDDSPIVPTEQDFHDDWIGAFIESLPKTRNEYAHGSRILHPSVLGSFEIVCDLINQLYPNEN